jgi:membrane protein YqaA with SNARE-associated domain
MASLKGVYNWVLHWAQTKWGVLALFILAFAESSFFPIPPDVLLIACCLADPKRSFYYALVCTIGSVLGAVGGYALGYYLWLTPAGEFSGIANFFFRHLFTVDGYYSVKEMYDQYNFWVVFTAGFTPIPFKLITITAGVFDINFWMFVAASIVSRGLRFFLVAGLIWKFGPPIKTFIDKYFNWLAIAFTVLLIGGFVLIKYLL